MRWITRRSLRLCFNTQPPEGGWTVFVRPLSEFKEFQHTAARRRLVPQGFDSSRNHMFQHTAARRRLARCPCLPPPLHQFQHTAARRRLGFDGFLFGFVSEVSTHSRPKAAGYPCLPIGFRLPVSTHSRPKAAGLYASRRREQGAGFNTQPPEGGWVEELDEK